MSAQRDAATGRFSGFNPAFRPTRRGCSRATIHRLATEALGGTPARYLPSRSGPGKPACPSETGQQVVALLDAYGLGASIHVWLTRAGRVGWRAFRNPVEIVTHALTVGVYDIRTKASWIAGDMEERLAEFVRRAA